MIEKVMIVSVGADSFNLVKNKLMYCLPAEYPTQVVDYLAFYRLKPISAVSHYGKVSEIMSNTRYSNFFEDKPVWIKKRQVMKCYRLEWLKKLPFAIKRCRKYYAIMKPVYTNLETLLASKTLTDLFVK